MPEAMNPTRQKSQQRASRMTASALVVLVSGMVGLAYAAEPLYKLFCQVTGYGGTPRIADKNSDMVTGDLITVRFDANVNRELPWRFRAPLNQVTVRFGEETLAFFEATNISDKPIVGTATFNVSPDRAASFFNKIQCFCFTEQVLAPGETVRMPVTFFVDPDMLNDTYARDLKTVTLSYTFFMNQDQSKAQVNQATYSN